VRDYDLVGDPSTIEPIAARVRAVIEPVLPQTELELSGAHEPLTAGWLKGMSR